MTELYDEFYFIDLVDKKRNLFENKIFDFLEKQKLSQDELIDLDEIIAKKFKVGEENAGKIIQTYVRYKAGGMDAKTAKKKIGRIK